MKIYEGSGSVQQQVGGGGFNPVREADVAGALERELNAQERRNQPYYQSVTQNNKAIVSNAERAAKKINDDIDANLKVLGEFSKTAQGILDQRTVDKINKDMEAAAMAGYMDEPFAEQQTAEYEAEEAKIEEGQSIMDEAAVKYEEGGGSPIVGEQLRTQFTGRNLVAYQVARAQRLGEEWPSFYASRLQYINSTQDPVIRQQREQEVVQEFITNTGAAAFSTGMANKYLYRTMRQVTTKAQLAWTTKKEQEILDGRLDTAANELWTGMQNGGIQTAVEKYRQQLKGLGYSDRAAKAELFKLLESEEYERQLTDEDIQLLRDTPIDGHPAGKTYGKVFGREIDRLEGAVADNEDLQLSRNAARRKADQANFENQFDELLTARNGEVSLNEIEAIRKQGRSQGLDTSFLDNYQTAESYSLDTAKRRLESIWQKQGFITQNDLRGMPSAIAQDSDVASWLKSGSLRANETKADREAIGTTVTRLTNELTDLNAMSKQGIEYDRIESEIRKDLNAQYQNNLQSGSYRNEDGSMNYSQALADARETVFKKAMTPPEEGGKDYRKFATAQDIDNRGSTRYKTRLSVYRNELKKDPTYINRSLFSSNAELDQAEKALNNQGDYPAIYEDLAAGQVNVTAYDIAMSQLKKSGRLDIKPQPVEEAVKAQDPELQRLLNFKSTAGRTERAFTPNMNAPEVSGVVNLKMVEGGALKGLTQDDYKWLAYTLTSEAALGTDDEYMVAASIINRYADPKWNRGATGIKDIIMAAGQYEGVYKGMSYHDSALTARLMSPEGQSKIVQMLRILKGRQDFKGQTQLSNRDAANDPMAHHRGNFFHYTGQRAKGAWRGPVPTYYTRFIR